MTTRLIEIKNRDQKTVWEAVWLVQVRHGDGLDWEVIVDVEKMD